MRNVLLSGLFLVAAAIGGCAGGVAPTSSSAPTNESVSTGGTAIHTVASEASGIGGVIMPAGPVGPRKPCTGKCPPPTGLEQ